MKTKKSFLVVFLFLPTLIYGCCDEIKSGNQTVNVTPLYNLQISQDDAQKMSDLMDINIFDKTDGDGSVVIGYWYEGGEKLPYSTHSDITVILSLSSDVQISGETFLSQCESYFDDASDFIFGGSGSNQYCISYVSEMREPPEGFCHATGIYKSHVVFQKDRLVITIIEYTTELNSTTKDGAILYIAQQLTK
jgi:hypothetical protein